LKRRHIKMIFPSFQDRSSREQAEKDERLFQSLERGNFRQVMNAIEDGACIDAVDSSGCLPVHYAADMQNSECLDYLLECRAKVDTRDYAGWTSLHIACGSGSMACVETLLQRCAPVDLREATGGCTALHLAASRGQNEVVMRLLQFGADINIPDK